MSKANQKNIISSPVGFHRVTGDELSEILFKQQEEEKEKLVTRENPLYRRRSKVRSEKTNLPGRENLSHKSKTKVEEKEEERDLSLHIGNPLETRQMDSHASGSRVIKKSYISDLIDLLKPFDYRGDVFSVLNFKGLSKLQHLEASTVSEDIRKSLKRMKTSSHSPSFRRALEQVFVMIGEKELSLDSLVAKSKDFLLTQIESAANRKMFPMQSHEELVASRYFIPGLSPEKAIALAEQVKLPILSYNEKLKSWYIATEEGIEAEMIFPSKGLYIELAYSNGTKKYPVSVEALFEELLESYPNLASSSAREVMDAKFRLE